MIDRHDVAKIETRLTVMEKIIDERNRASKDEHTQIIDELKSIKKDVSHLKTTVASVSAFVAMLTSVTIKKFLPLIFITMLMIPQTAHAQEHTFGIAANPSFLVYIIGAQGGWPIYSCTGFVVKKDEIVTAGHCVQEGA
jgi:hypothetical protein